MSDTMVMRGVTCAVLYVDATAVGANNGSTPTDALTSLPACASLAANTVYIVRRSHTQTWTVGTNTNANVYVLGMPLSTDPLYNGAPAAAKSAWDADGATYPVLTMSAGAANYKFTGTTCGLGRVWIKYPSGGAVSTVPAIWVTGANFFFQYVKYTLASYDLTAATSPSATRPGTIYVDADEPLCDNLYIESVWDDTTSAPTAAANQYGIEFSTNCTHATMRNCTVWFCGYRSTSAPRGGIKFNASVDRSSFDNLTIKYVENKNASAVSMGGGFVVLGTSVEASGNVFRNITFTRDRNFTNSPTTTTSFTNGGGIAAIHIGQAGAGAIIDTLTVDLTGEPGQMLGVRIVQSVINTYYNANAHHITISNITVTKPSSITLTEGTTSFYALSMDIGKAIVQTVNAAAPNGYSLVLGVGSSSMHAPCFKAMTLNGAVSATCGIDYMEVTSWTQGYVLANAFDVGASTGPTGLIYIGTATISGTWNTTAMVRVGIRSTLVIDSINVTIVVGFQDTGGGTAAVYVNNNNNTAGNWYAENVNFKAFATNVSRTGGASSAIKFDIKLSSTVGIWLAPFPLPGKAVSPGSSGQKTFTFYVAYKTYTTFDPTKIRIFIQAPSGGAGTKMATFDSLHDAVWSSDGSTWVNDTGLTVMKCVFKIPVDRNESCYVRVMHNWYQASSYWYLDPQFTVT